MIYRIVLAVLLLSVPAGGVAGEPSRENVPVVPSAKSEKEALRGLQSLWRVQLRIPGATESLRTEAVKQLREQLPQLDTTGSADDWTLEILFSREFVPEAAPRSNGWEPSVISCRICVVKTAVVSGRLVTAVAYQGQWLRMGSGSPAIPDSRIELGSMEMGRTLNTAIAWFAGEWRQANPNAKQK